MTTPAIEKKFVRTSNGNIAYLETGGAEKPPVLFVHGITTSSYLWRHVLRFLQKRSILRRLLRLAPRVVEPIQVANGVLGVNVRKRRQARIRVEQKRLGLLILSEFDLTHAVVSPVVRHGPMILTKDTFRGCDEIAEQGLSFLNPARL